MEKMRNFWLAILASCVFATFLCGACDFSEFDRAFENAKQRAKLQTDIKAIYTKAIINDDKECKIGSLKRIIKLNNALGIKSANFEKELESLEPKKITNKSVQKIEKSANKITDKSAKKLRVLGVNSDEKILKIKLNQNIEKSQIKNFTIAEKSSFRDIYDFKGLLDIKVGKLDKKISPKLRIAQKDPEYIRIVFEYDKKEEVELEFGQNELIFKSKSSPQKEQKEAKLSPQKEPKEAKKQTKEPKKQSNEQKQASTQKSQNEKQTNTIKSPPTEPKKALAKKEKASKIIVLDAGHGGNDAGATSLNKKLLEKHIVLSVSKKTAALLKERGYKVYFTRSNDRFIKLRERTSFANEKNAHLFISIHANAAPNKEKAKSMSGIETFFLSPSRSERSMNAANLENKADTDEMNYFTKISFLNFLNREKIIASNKLAIDMQAALLKSVRASYKVSDGGVREAPFWVLVGALMPAVLIEIGYISHPDESQKIANAKYQDRLAKGIADGVDEYFAKNR